MLKFSEYAHQSLACRSFVQKCEMMEFKALEEETELQNRREQLIKQRVAAVDIRRARRSRALVVQTEYDRLRFDGDEGLRRIHTEIQTVSRSIQQVSDYGVEGRGAV